MAGKIEIPDELKRDVAGSKWGKILLATPIVMTVIATMLAGLASSEMTKAQYDRSLAAQLQSKAGDQWGFYQAKKLRGALAHNELDLLAATSDVKPLAATVLGDADAPTVAALTKYQLPGRTPVKFDESVNAALVAVAHSVPESEVKAALVNVKATALAEALNGASQAAADFDNATKTINETADRFDETLRAGDRNQYRDFCAARLRYLGARYEAEAKLNGTIAGIYELQVRQGNISAERHHERSGKFFFGMLAAQMGVIIATFSMAARQKSVLWSLAAAAGLAAVSFSVYVWLCV